jgi:outer membrane lipoprotein LolB
VHSKKTLNLIRTSLLTSSFLLLVACSNLKTPSLNVDWQDHQVRINAYQQWELRGRLNIRTENDSTTITINWTQEADNFLINLSGTLGFGAVQMEGNNQSVRLEKAGETPQFANSVEEISVNYLGYEFPASQLYYWIRGIPSPEQTNTADIQLNENQLLGSLHQGEWQLEYDRYQMQSNGLILPGRIRMEHTPYRLTFIINRW